MAITRSVIMTIKKHPLYKQHKRKEQFLKAYLESCLRSEELAAIRELAANMPQVPKKLWLLTLVGKQDLWAKNTASVERFYREGGFDDIIQSIKASQVNELFRHELAFASLVISNFMSSRGDLIAMNQAGYDHAQQVRSLRRLFELFDSLRKWEAGL